MLKKIQLARFDWPNNCDSVDVEMDGFVLEKNSAFKMLGLSFTSKLNLGSYVASTAKKCTCFTALTDLVPPPLTRSPSTRFADRQHKLQFLFLETVSRSMPIVFYHVRLYCGILCLRIVFL